MEYWVALILWKFAESALNAAPTVLVGFAIAGLVRARGAGRVRSAFGLTVSAPRAVAAALLLGAILPVCALGALPVAVELRRAGARIAATVAFALFAGVVNPMSLAYGLSEVPPTPLIAGLLAAAGVAVAAGAAVGALARPNPAGDSVTDDPPPGFIAAVAASIRGVGGACIFVGLLGATALATALPAGWLGESVLMVHPRGAIFVAGTLLLPAYVPPDLAMLHARELTSLNTVPGVLPAWLAVVCGVTLGTIAWLWRLFATPAAITGAAVVVVAGLAAGLLGDVTLRTHAPPGEDSHAFDALGRPYNLGHPGRDESPTAAAGQLIRRQLRAQPSAVGALSAIALLSVLPPVWTRRRTASRDRIAPDARPAGLSRPARLAAGALCAAGVAVAGLYIYFPAPHWVFAEMRQVDAELGGALVAGDTDAANRHTQRLRQLADRARVSVRLRSIAAPTGALAALDEMEARLAEITLAPGHLTPARTPATDAHLAFTRALRAAERAARNGATPPSER